MSQHEDLECGQSIWHRLLNILQDFKKSFKLAICTVIVGSIAIVFILGFMPIVAKIWEKCWPNSQVTAVRLDKDAGLQMTIQTADRTDPIVFTTAVVMANRIFNPSHLELQDEDSAVLRADGLVSTKRNMSPLQRDVWDRLPVSVQDWWKRYSDESLDMSWRNADGSGEFLNLTALEKPPYQPETLHRKLSDSCSYGALVGYVMGDEMPTATETHNNSLVQKHNGVFRIGRWATLKRKGNTLLVQDSWGKTDSIRVPYKTWHLILCVNDAIPNGDSLDAYAGRSKIKSGNVALDLGCVPTIRASKKISRDSLCKQDDTVHVFEAATYKGIIGSTQIWYLDNRGFFNVQILKFKKHIEGEKKLSDFNPF